MNWWLKQYSEEKEIRLAMLFIGIKAYQVLIKYKQRAYNKYFGLPTL